MKSICTEFLINLQQISLLNKLDIHDMYVTKNNDILGVVHGKEARVRVEGALGST